MTKTTKKKKQKGTAHSTVQTRPTLTVDYNRLELITTLCLTLKDTFNRAYDSFVSTKNGDVTTFQRIYKQLVTSFSSIETSCLMILESCPQSKNEDDRNLFLRVAFIAEGIFAARGTLINIDRIHLKDSGNTDDQIYKEVLPYLLHSYRFLEAYRTTKKARDETDALFDKIIQWFNLIVMYDIELPSEFQKRATYLAYHLNPTDPWKKILLQTITAALLHEKNMSMDRVVKCLEGITDPLKKLPDEANEEVARRLSFVIDITDDLLSEWLDLLYETAGTNKDYQKANEILQYVRRLTGLGLAVLDKARKLKGDSREINEREEKWLRIYLATERESERIQTLIQGQAEEATQAGNFLIAQEERLQALRAKKKIRAEQQSKIDALRKAENTHAKNTDEASRTETKSQGESVAEPPCRFDGESKVEKDNHNNDFKASSLLDEINRNWQLALDLNKQASEKFKTLEGIFELIRKAVEDPNNNMRRYNFSIKESLSSAQETLPDCLASLKEAGKHIRLAQGCLQHLMSNAWELNRVSEDDLASVHQFTTETREIIENNIEEVKEHCELIRQYLALKKQRLKAQDRENSNGEKQYYKGGGMHYAPSEETLLFNTLCFDIDNLNSILGEIKENTKAEEAVLSTSPISASQSNVIVSRERRSVSSPPMPSSQSNVIVSRERRSVSSPPIFDQGDRMDCYILGTSFFCPRVKEVLTSSHLSAPKAQRG